MRSFTKNIRNYGPTGNQTKKNTEQHHFAEVLLPINSYVFDASAPLYPQPTEEDLERRELLYDLAERLLELLEQHCTGRQQEIARMYFLEGKTQTQIADQLGISQTGVNKQLYGNAQYGNQYQGKTYGGIRNRLLKLVQKDPEALSLAREIWGPGCKEVLAGG